MKVLYVFSQPRKQWETVIEKRQMPDNVLYGMNWLKSVGHKTECSDRGFSTHNLLRWPISPIQKFFIKQIGCGFQLDQVFFLLSQLNSADLVISTNDSCGLPICLLKMLKLVSTPHIYFHIDINSFSKSKVLLSVIKKLLPQPEAIACFSQDRVKYIKALLNNKSKNIYYIPPGVDVNFFQPKKIKAKYDIVSIGRDENRDYKTLFKAVKNIKTKTMVICDRKNIKGLSIPENVSTINGANYGQVRQAYHQAKIVIIPTKMNSVSGQISYLEALACGKPTIASSTPALKQFIPKNKNYGAIFFKPGDHHNLRHKLSLLLKNNHRQKLLSKNSRKIALAFSTKKFAEKINCIIKAGLKK